MNTNDITRSDTFYITCSIFQQRLIVPEITETGPSLIKKEWNKIWKRKETDKQNKKREM